MAADAASRCLWLRRIAEADTSSCFACTNLRSLEHFQEKWNPVFRPKMRQRKNARAVPKNIAGVAPTLGHERLVVTGVQEAASLTPPLEGSPGRARFPAIPPNMTMPGDSYGY